MPQSTIQEQEALKSYEGDAAYIFISYAHADADIILPIIRQLQSDGFRLWYDEGIIGNTDWVDVIAERLSRSQLFIAFLTKNYLDSENCLDELFYAREQCPNRLLVYLDDTEVSKGIRMRYCRRQALYHWQCANSRCKNEEAFYHELYRVHGIEECRIQSQTTAQDAQTTEEQDRLPEFEIVDGVLMAYHGKRTHVVIPEGITKIEMRAFKGNEQIETVVFPESLITVGFESFRKCTHLKTVHTNDRLVSIGRDAFSYCAELREIQLPDSLKTLRTGAFFRCVALEQINIPQSVTTIPSWAFAFCRGLKLQSVTIPASVKIAETAFRGCVPSVERLGQRVTG